MALVFKDLCREELRRAGMAGLGNLWVRTVLDLGATALAERSSAHANDEEAVVRDNRLAVIGVVLLLAPLFFVATSTLKYGLGLGSLFDPVNRAFLSAPESHRVFNQVATVVFLVELGLALALNAYAVVQLNVSKEAGTIVSTIRLRINLLNLAVAAMSFLLFVTLLGIA